MKRVKVATVWLDGCSGCHMSLLDMDATIIALARRIDIVYGPLVDEQEFPEDVDVTLVEGRGQLAGRCVAGAEDSTAHQDADRAGRLRGDEQCAGDAECDSRQPVAAEDLWRRQGCSGRSAAGTAEPVTTGARVCEGRYVFAGMSAEFEADCGCADGSAGWEEA